MTPDTFVAKQRASQLQECSMLGTPTPAQADPAGERDRFERGVRTDGGGDWARGGRCHCFAQAYEGEHADLDPAHGRLRQLAPAPETAPRPIVSDMARLFVEPATAPGMLRRRTVGRSLRAA